MSPADPVQPIGDDEVDQNRLGSSFARLMTWLRSLSGPAIGLIVVLGLFIVLFKIKGDDESLKTFLSFRNLQVLFHDITITGVISLGALLIIISGGIDLSVGSVAALVT